ncbi:MAG TPA: hypothetical protein VMT88_13600, partial [Actinomycetes bacterium]|nr:hypothetical protein [Actinomycetes bacterium]
MQTRRREQSGASRYRAPLVVALLIAPLVLLIAGSAWGTPGGKLDTTAEPPVVFIGVPGLRWTDVSAASTPNISAFVADTAVAQLSVRSVYRVTCPIDGWLTLGAGRRAAAQRVPDIDETENVPDLNEFCDPIPPVVDHRVEGWDSLVAYNDDLSFNAQLGQLSDAIRSNGECAT